MADTSPDRISGCGLLSAVFGRRPRRSHSSPPSPPSHHVNNNNNVNQNVKPSSDMWNSKRRRGHSDDHDDLLPTNHPQTRVVMIQNQQTKQHVNETSKATTQQPRSKVPKEALGISGELESYITDHQKSKGSSTLVRASSSNVMLFGDLGNLRQGGGGGNNTNSPKEDNFIANNNGEGRRCANNNAGNRTKENQKDNEGVSLCRAISTRMDPEQLKIMGNEDYKNGRFAEALALYDAAIAIDPNKASYRSNRSATLTALGRLIEAVFEVREAIRIEPHYHRAHHRLGSLYLRYIGTFPNFHVSFNWD